MITYHGWSIWYRKQCQNLKSNIFLSHGAIQVHQHESWKGFLGLLTSELQTYFCFMQWVPHKLLLWNTYTTNILQSKYSIMQLTCGFDKFMRIKFCFVSSKNEQNYTLIPSLISWDCVKYSCLFNIYNISLRGHTL